MFGLTHLISPTYWLNSFPTLTQEVLSKLGFEGGISKFLGEDLCCPKNAERTLAGSHSYTGPAPKVVQSPDSQFADSVSYLAARYVFTFADFFGVLEIHRAYQSAVAAEGCFLAHRPALFRIQAEALLPSRKASRDRVSCR